jgi:hypothetical protein
MQLMELKEVSESGMGETPQLREVRQTLFERLEELQDIKVL